MSISREPRAGEMMRDVRVDEATLAVDLMDGRTTIVTLLWYRRARPPSGNTGRSVEADLASIGPKSTRTSARWASSWGRPPQPRAELGASTSGLRAARLEGQPEPPCGRPLRGSARAGLGCRATARRRWPSPE